MAFLLPLTIFAALAVAVAAGVTVTVSSSAGHTISEEGVHYECVDDLDDFNCLNWDSSSQFQYAQSVKELPPILRKHGGTLEGQGIFYFAGRQEVISHQALIQWAMEFSEAHKEAFLYIKYYGHLPNHHDDGKLASNQGMYVIPSAKSGGEGGSHLKILPTTHDQLWQEQLVVLSVEELRMSGLEVGAFNLGLGDYFLVEKLIFVQGVNITGMDHIKNFCSSSITTVSSRLK